MSFSTKDAAAIHVLRVINPRSIIENLEFGGLIYRTGSGQFDYTIPRCGGGRRRACSGQVDRSNVSLEGIQLPAGATEVGCYHTHGDYTLPGREVSNCPTERRVTNLAELDQFQPATPFGYRARTNDFFSSTDIEAFRERGRGIQGYRAYLGTPSGVFYYYDPPGDRNQHVLYRGNRPVVRP